MADLAFETDVLIVGSGPTGSTTALILASHGVRAHLVTRTNFLADTPRAHITNQRTMEVLRDLDLEEECRRNGTAWEFMGDTMFTTSLVGEELVRLRTWGTGDARKGEYVRGSPCPLLDLIQPEIEPILFKAAANRGASFSFNTEYVSHEQSSAGVDVRLRNLLSGHEYTVRAKYLVGADGARSRIVEDIGLNIEGEMARAGTAYVIFDADLTQYAQHRPSILHWIVSPDAAFGEIGMGLLRAVKPWTRWIAGWGFDLSKGDPDLSREAVLEKIYALIGRSDIDVEIVRSSTWFVNQLYATEYSKGRVLCGGDAVHRHPPSSGLGLNTCVQDAFNLGWKLAYVINGHAGESLLQSYSDERAPVGKQIVLRANQSRLDYGPLNAVFRVPGAKRPIAAGIERFKDPGAEGVAARKAACEALELKNREFNAQGVEMNQRYESSAVIADRAQEPETWTRDRELHLQATSRPGAKIPHAWVIGKDGRRLSTLDLVGKGKFTLVTGLAGGNWLGAVERMQRPYLRAVAIGAPGALDVYCEWQQVREIEEGGALLVRPDGYVAWRSDGAAASEAAAKTELSKALDRVLGL